MSATKQEGGIKTMFAAIVIPAAFVISVILFKFVLGNPGNFIEGNTEGEPIKEGVGSYLATIYKGGIIVPILITMLLTVITFTIERFITINAAKGNGAVESFIGRIRAMLAKNDFDGAHKECDRQKGSVANVVKAGLGMYKQMEGDKALDKERKILAIQKELEEATTLELPMMSKNLVIISTIASIATLMGLLGTVIGMIRAFKALAQAGAPDAIALSTGISEALINTALGIGTSAVAIIMYNYFTNKIDSLTYGIDEAGYSIVQNFAANYKG
jgi:biopolymer transport protein ExbB